MGKLSLSGVMQGPMSVFYSPSGQTTFWVTQNIRLPNSPNISLVERQVELWLTSLSKDGFSLINWRVEKPRINLRVAVGRTLNRVVDGKLVISVTINGSVIDAGLSRSWATSISATAKKLLARQFIESYPLEKELSVVMFPSGSFDSIGVTRCSFTSTGEALATQLSNILRSIKFLVELHGAVFVDEPRFDQSQSLLLKIQWQQNVADTTRQELLKMIKSLFKKMLGREPIAYFC